uniref:Putative tail tubular protein n=2 Tax=viral metagenome TaxID=1070528 RepID=A0A6M3XNH3_9ZZZZ
MAYLLQKAFNGGVWSPLLEGRVDLEKYQNACYRLENFIIDPRGPAVFRPGLKYIGGTKTHSKLSRLIPFEFSVTQAYQIEFGDQYIRFKRNKAPITLTAQNITGITKANPAVVNYSGDDTYANGDRILINGVVGMIQVNNREFAVANVNVGANTFELSGINSTAYSTYASGGTVAEIYEIISPYLEADLAGIKYCQSADVLYLFHASYAPRKLSRTGHTSWTLSTINFRPPAVKEQGIKPAATLTLAAVTGVGITFTAGAAVFQTGDVKRLITSGAGRASITAFISTTQVTCDIIDDFAAVGPIASQSWSLLGSPTGEITPSIDKPVGAICTVISTGESETFTNLLDHPNPANNNWLVSGLGTSEYYIVNTAAFYSATEPNAVYINGVAAVKGTLGSLGITQWGWGNNDALGYNTIYIRLSDGADPDTKSTWIVPDDDFIKRSLIAATANLFRSADVGKYIRIHGGLIKIASYTSATEVKGEILKELTAVTEAASWTLESDVWNSTNGYPSCGTFFEERLCLAGSPAYPETLWGSVVGDYENHTPGVDDSDAYEFTMTGREVSEISWIEPDEYLLIGSAGKISRLGPDDTGQALTPLNVIAKRQIPWGCADILPVAVDNAVLYVQRTGFDNTKGLSLGELTWTWEKEKYVAPDLTLLAEHITGTGIKGVAFQRKPHTILWCYTAAGVLIAMTYIRDQDVIAWHKHPIDGTIESLSAIPGGGYTEIWAIVNRTINGATVRNVELMEAPFNDTPADYISNKGLNAFFVDSGTTYNGAAATVISGLSHLEGKAVAVLADGSMVAGKTVSGGKITLPVSASVVHVGLPYTGTIQTMRLDTQLRDGTFQGRVKKIHEINVRVYRSGPFKIGRDANNLDACFDRDATITMGSPYDLFTGDIPIGFDDSWNKEARIMIVQDKPMPLTVVALISEVSV